MKDLLIFLLKLFLGKSAKKITGIDWSMSHTIVKAYGSEIKGLTFLKSSADFTINF